MPTFNTELRFRNDYRRLTPDQQRRYRTALRAFIRALQLWEAGGCVGYPPFPKSLGVKPMSSRRNILEFAWAPDGRCTWEFGTPQRPPKSHVTWRRIGSNAIYDDP